jgi:hypothetical protein
VCGRQVDGNASVVFCRAHLQCHYVCLLFFPIFTYMSPFVHSMNFEAQFFMNTTCRYYRVRAYDIVICIHY